jgi:hypothetical protein
MGFNTSVISTWVQMYEGQPGTTATTLYTAPAISSNITGSKTATAKITEIVVNNTTANTVTLTIGIVPSGGTLGATNEIMTAATIVPGPQSLPFNTNMLPQSTIQALQNTSGAITLTISGVEVQ